MLLVAVALMLILASAAASLLLALPVAVAAESLHERSAALARRFWIVTNILPLAAGCLLTALACLYVAFGNIASSPHQESVRGHLCLLNLLKSPDAPFRFHLFALMAVALLLFALGRFVFGLLNSRRAEDLAQSLVTDSGRQPGQAPVVLLDSPEPDCFSLGVARPVVLVTQGLVETLEPDEARAVLAHEQCHVRHRDSLAELLLRLVTDPLIWLPTTHYFLFFARAAMERTCDESAAAVVGSGPLISALRRMAAAKTARHLKLQGDLAPLRPTFAGHATPEARIIALEGQKYTSLALPLSVIIGIELALMVATLVLLRQSLHDTLYCLASSLLHLFGSA